LCAYRMNLSRLFLQTHTQRLVARSVKRFARARAQCLNGHIACMRAPKKRASASASSHESQLSRIQDLALLLACRYHYAFPFMLPVLQKPCALLLSSQRHVQPRVLALLLSACCYYNGLTFMQSLTYGELLSHPQQLTPVPRKAKSDYCR
jgi:hypothetical protein